MIIFINSVSVFALTVQCVLRSGRTGQVLLIGFVYGAEYIGKGLGAEQMHDIASFVEQVLPDIRFPADDADAATPRAPAGA